MQLKRNKGMEFETLKKSHKKQIIIGAIALCVIGGALTFNLTRAKYRLTDSIPLVKGTVNYSVPDMRVVAINVSEDGTNYNIADEIPIGEYTLNADKTICKVATNTSGIENAPQDNNITIEYVDGKINFKGITKNNTRCYLYFDKIRDTENPTINSVTTSVTKNSITVNVSASDNKGVTEYWYSINGGTYTSKTTSSHIFTGLSSGTSYTIRVYVKDEAGNISAITTKSATTQQSVQTIENIIETLSAKTIEPTFTNAATSNEGVYSVSDPMYGGTSYYWRGVATTNYVKFAGFCWRIVRINGDKTMRLIYDGTTCHANGTQTADSIAKTSIAYNSSYNRSEYVGWTYNTGSQRTTSGTASNIKTQTENWYTSNITGTNANKVADGKFCNDRDTASGYSWSSQPTSTFYYSGYDRSGAKNESSVTPTFACPSGDVYILKVGAITMDEVVMAGAKWVTANSLYYLYNGQYYWTMSPYYWWYYSSSYRSTYMFFVNMSGGLGIPSADNTNVGIRPVINLRSDVTFSGGNGTQNNPYVVQ